ncbi:hypothetical protein D9619_011569 [Psilocybe cf. subviscida]|uniref:Uncharacterized protein n=1 Tax=Psilocybe cf. subviscida TaxID=2480587 RepID=A0A8H5BT43_9AGAR|nr:hypothetical protein D9619_011569 [Psilocybe cf. subviscida]
MDAVMEEDMLRMEDEGEGEGGTEPSEDRGEGRGLRWLSKRRSTSQRDFSFDDGQLEGTSEDSDGDDNSDDGRRSGVPRTSFRARPQ